MPVYFCGACGHACQDHFRFCGQCGAPLPLPAPAGHRQGGTTNDTHAEQDVLRYKPQFLDWQDKTVTFELREIQLFFAPKTKASYRCQQEKERSICVSSYGRIGIVKKAKMNGDSLACTYSASDHVANIRKAQLSGQTLSMTLNGRDWTITFSSAGEAQKAASAILTVAMMLFQGPPPFELSGSEVKDRFVRPADDIIISSNLPPGWKVCYFNEGPRKYTYYMDLRNLQTTWQLPADVVEMVSLSTKKRYPRFLADRGFFVSFAMWSIYYEVQSSLDLDPDFIYRGSFPVNDVFSSTSGMEPYWCRPGAVNAHDGQTSTVLNLTFFTSKACNLTSDGTISESFLDRVWLPAMLNALRPNKFFTGVIMDDGKADPKAEPMQWPWRTEDTFIPNSFGKFLQMLKMSTKKFAELRLSRGSLKCVFPEQKNPLTHRLEMKIVSGRHMPKKDLFGKIDTFVDCSLSGVQTSPEKLSTRYIPSEYNPDWHHAENFGAIPRFTFFTSSNKSVRAENVVWDHNTVKYNDLVGNMPFDIPSDKLMHENWYPVFDPKSQKKIVGNDKQESLILVQTEWSDFHSASSLFSATGGGGAGQLAVLDLSGCTELTPQVLSSTLQGVGKLKELVLGSMAPACGPVIVESLIKSMWRSGYAVPQAWRPGTEFTLGQKSAYLTGKFVVVKGLGHGWEMKQTPDGKQYFINHIRKGTQWEAPGNGFVFGQVAGVKDAESWVIDVEGLTRVVPLKEIGMIAPELRPWASSLRVLDVSDLRVNVEHLQSLAETIVLMPNLATIKQRNVDPSFLLNAMRSCREIGGTLPPLQQIDLSQLNTGAVYDWSALVPALLAVRETLNTPGAEIMLSGLFSSCDVGQQMKIFGDLMSILDLTSLSTSVIEVPPAAGAQTAVLSGIIESSRFCGILDCSDKSLRIVTATIQGMKRNCFISGLILRRIEKLPNMMYPLGDTMLSKEMVEMLQQNQTMKSLDMAENSMLRVDFPPGATLDTVPNSHLCTRILARNSWPSGSEMTNVAGILNGLGQNRSITALDVRLCDLSDVGGTALGQAMRSNRTVTSLKFDVNGLSIEGIKGFKGCLYGNKKLVDVPPPYVDIMCLLGPQEQIIQSSLREVQEAKVKIKIACRGGRVKPWLGNPALKAKSLEELRAAKRREGAARRYMKKVRETVKDVWGRIDGNKQLQQEKMMVKEQKRYDQVMRQEAKKQKFLSLRYNKMKNVQYKRYRSGGYGRYRRDRYYHDNYYYNDHYHHDYDRYDDDYDFDDDGNAMMAADMNEQDLAEEAALDADGGKEQDGEQEQDDANDLEDVEGYGGSGPRDLWDGGEDRSRNMKIMRAMKASVEELNLELGKQDHLLQSEIDAALGCSVLKYQTLQAWLSSSVDPQASGVVLVTQASLDRLPRLEAQLLAWRGAASVALYVPWSDQRQETEDRLNSIRDMYGRLLDAGVGGVVVSILFGNSPSEHEYNNLYPINALRNLALNTSKFCAAELVLLVDVDFLPSKALVDKCQDEEYLAAMRQMTSAGSALVVPAFEMQELDADASHLSMEELQELCKEGRAEGFHVTNYPKGHSPTDFERWFSSTEPYEVEYQSNYEPYVIMNVKTVPKYDERFRGYGMNKISHLYEVSRTHRLVVLPQVFIAAYEHAKSTSWERTFGEKRDPAHAVRIAVLWGRFRQEKDSEYSDKVDRLAPAVLSWPSKRSDPTAAVQTSHALVVSFARRRKPLRMFERSRSKLQELLASRCPRRHPTLLSAEAF